MLNVIPPRRLGVMILLHSQQKIPFKQKGTTPVTSI